MKSFATLNSSCDIADDCAQTALSLGISLFIQSGQCLNKGNTGFNHGRKLPGKENKIRFFYFGRFFTRLPGARFSLKRKDHKATTHQTGHSVVLVKSFLNAGDNASGRVTRLVGEGDHKKVIMEIVASTVPIHWFDFFSESSPTAFT